MCSPGDVAGGVGAADGKGVGPDLMGHGGGCRASAPGAIAGLSEDHGQLCVGIARREWQRVGVMMVVLAVAQGGLLP